MAAPTPANPGLSPNTYDPTGHQTNVAYRLDNVQTDTSVTPNVTYGDLGVQVDVSVSAPTDVTASGTMSAAQPVINTPVANATVVLALGIGQSAWKAQLLAGTGGFTSGSTIVADKSLDGATTWFTASFKVTGASPATPQSTVVGPGPLELTGNCAGATHVRLRCSVLNGAETIAARINASVGTADVGLLSSIPAGSNLIGGVNLQQVGGNAVAVGSNAVPTLSSAAMGYVAAYGSNAAALTANTDYAFKWGVGGTTQVNHILIQNNSTININFELDTATNAGSPILSNTLGQNTLFLDVQTTAVHIQGNGTPNVGGSSSGNIVIKGWL